MPTSAPQELEEYTLKTLALVICDADLWALHEFTLEQYQEFETVLQFCIRAVEQNPSCGWMAGPLLEIRKRVQDRLQFNSIMRGDLWL